MYAVDMADILSSMKTTDSRRRASGQGQGVGHTYTVLSSGVTAAAEAASPVENDLSVLVVNRGPSRYVAALFESLYQAGFSRISYVGSHADRAASCVQAASRFPGVRILLPTKTLHAGGLVNLGMREMGAGKVLVLWSDMRLNLPAISIRLRRKIQESSAFCIAPSLQLEGGASIASVFSPSAVPAGSDKNFAQHDKSNFPFEARLKAPDASPSLFLRDYCGIYDAKKFLASGGFDESMQDPWWQSLDFGLGVWAAGETIEYMRALSLSYAADAPALGPAHPESREACASWARFWYKRLAVSGTAIGMRAFLAARGGNIADGFREYRNLRKDLRALHTSHDTSHTSHTSRLSPPTAPASAVLLSFPAREQSS